jgi:hypothetical protein
LIPKTRESLAGVSITGRILEKFQVVVLLLVETIGRKMHV